MKSFDEENLKVLELPPDTTEWKDVKEAYHRLCKKYHPDKQQSEEDRCDVKLNAKFLAVIHAYYKLEEEINRHDGSILSQRGEKVEEDDRCYEPGEDTHLAKYTPDECKTKGCSLRANGNLRVTKGKCCNLCSKKNDNHATMCTKYLHYRELLGTKHMDRAWVHKKNEWWYWCDLCKVDTEKGHFQKWKHVEKEHAHAELLSAATPSHSVAPSVEPASALPPRSGLQDLRQAGPPPHPPVPAQLRERSPPCLPSPTKQRPPPPACSMPPLEPPAQPPSRPPSSLACARPPSSTSDIATSASKPSLHHLNAASPSEPCSSAAPSQVVLPPNCQVPIPGEMPPSYMAPPMAQPPLHNFLPPPGKVILLSDNTRSMIRPPRPPPPLSNKLVHAQSIFPTQSPPEQHNGTAAQCQHPPLFKAAPRKPPPAALSVGTSTNFFYRPHSGAIGVLNYACDDTTQIQQTEDQRILTRKEPILNIVASKDTPVDGKRSKPYIPNNPTIPPDILPSPAQFHGTCSSDSPSSGDEICFKGWAT